MTPEEAETIASAMSNKNLAQHIRPGHIFSFNEGDVVLFKACLVEAANRLQHVPDQHTIQT